MIRPQAGRSRLVNNKQPLFPSLSCAVLQMTSYAAFSSPRTPFSLSPASTTKASPSVLFPHHLSESNLSSSSTATTSYSVVFLSLLGDNNLSLSSMARGNDSFFSPHRAERQ